MKWYKNGENSTVRSFRLPLHNRYYSGDQINNDKMGQSCSKYGGEEMDAGFWQET
jgi:hypothetical protein